MVSGVRREECGFTYLALLFAIALMGVLLAAAGTEWKTVSRRDKEEQLLATGDEIRVAIGRYFLESPTGLRQFPRKLEDLLDDRRGLKPEHWLRHLYPDPLTGSTDWELITSPDGGVMGVASRGQGVPIKRVSFGDRYERDFKDKDCYCEWKFVFKPARHRRRALDSAIKATPPAELSTPAPTAPPDT